MNENVLGLFIMINFICILLLLISKDSRLFKELTLYKLTYTYPYLHRDLIQDTYESFI